MIHLSHSVSGSQIGAELAVNQEELAYALVAIAEGVPDDTELLYYLSGEDQRKVRDLCNAIAV